MLSEFEKKVSDYAKANGLFGSAQRLLLAVSGGADSMALLHAMHELKAAGFLKCELLCAHLNHQLRGNEADLDEEFVAARAARLNVSLTIERMDVREYSRREKLSIETAARQLRISALSRIAKENYCRAIVTAHQKNDNAETIIQRLARGTGFRGLAGIWPVRVFHDGTKFVRPLLCVGRDEILEYLGEKNLEWRLDRTNTDFAYRRNFIRHRLLPELQRNAPHSIVEQLSELSESFRRFHMKIENRVSQLWPEVAYRDGDKMGLHIEMFLAQPKPVQVELVRKCLAQIGCGEGYLTRGHYEDILELGRRNASGRKIQLPGGFLVLYEYEELIFRTYRRRSVGQAPPCGDGQSDQPIILKVPGRTRCGEHLMEATIHAFPGGSNTVRHPQGSPTLQEFVVNKIDCLERFDFEKVKPPLVVRPRRAGDRFIPLGMTSQKKLGKFLTDQQVPRRLREKVLVIADAEKIVWVCPVRISERAKITDETRRILQLRITDFTEHQKSVDATQPGQ